MLIIRFRKSVVEGAVGAGERGARLGVDVQPDNVDVVGAGPPALDVGDGVGVWGPEHEDFGVGGDGRVDGLPGGYVLGLGCFWGRRFGLGRWV